MDNFSYKLVPGTKELIKIERKYINEIRLSRQLSYNNEERKIIANQNYSLNSKVAFRPEGRGYLYFGTVNEIDNLTCTIEYIPYCSIINNNKKVFHYPNCRYFIDKYYHTIKVAFLFYKNFSKYLKLDRNILIGTSQYKNCYGLYIRKEADDICLINVYLDDSTQMKIKPFIWIDCIKDYYYTYNDKRFEKNEETEKKLIELQKNKKHFYVSYAAISFFSRKNNNILDLLKPIKEINKTKKTKFCSFVCRNFLLNRYSGVRERVNFYNILKNKKEVICPKDNSRTTTSLFDDNIKLIEECVFNISFENNDVIGWITEKIVNSYLAGCIPIYWGPDDIYEYFNKNSFINAKDFNSYEELSNYIIDLYENKEKLQKYLETAPCTKEGLQKLFWWINDLI
jgi:hypothetical protein